MASRRIVKPTAAGPAGSHPYDLVSRIAAALPNLRPAEQKVAEVILGDVPTAATDSIDALAARAGVSEASVTRFAKAMGCRDVRALKINLAQAAAVGHRFLNGGEALAVPQHETAERIFADIVATLDVNRALIDPVACARAAKLIVEARMTHVFGMGGGSTILADEARFRLMRLGLPVATYQDSVLQRMVAATLDKMNVVLAFSVTGRTQELLAACRVARDYGASIVAVTDPDAPLAEAADIVLPVRTIETDFIFKPSSVRYALLMALDVLATEIALMQKPRSQDLLRRIKFVLDASRGGSDRQPLGD